MMRVRGPPSKGEPDGPLFRSADWGFGSVGVLDSSEAGAVF
jgi:hypothetical protein